MKLCRSCNTEKSHAEFHRRKGVASGLDSRCKVCSKAKTTAWREANRSKWNAYVAGRYLASEARAERVAAAAERKAAFAANKAERLAEYRRRGELNPTVQAYRKTYRKLPHVVAKAQARNVLPATRARHAEWARKRAAAEPQFRLNSRVSCAVRASLTSGKGGRRWESIVGYSLADLSKHLARQFLPGMTWENYGAWEIDHVQPLASFSFATADDPEFRAAWALSNLRPLWAPENRSKHARRTLLL